MELEMKVWQWSVKHSKETQHWKSLVWKVNGNSSSTVPIRDNEWCDDIDNDIGDLGVKVLCSMLQVNTTLTDLCLDGRVKKHLPSIREGCEIRKMYSGKETILVMLEQQWLLKYFMKTHQSGNWVWMVWDMLLKRVKTMINKVCLKRQ